MAQEQVTKVVKETQNEQAPKPQETKAEHGNAGDDKKGEDKKDESTGKDDKVPIPSQWFSGSLSRRCRPMSNPRTMTRRP